MIGKLITTLPKRSLYKVLKMALDQINRSVNLKFALISPVLFFFQFCDVKKLEVNFRVTVFAYAFNFCVG